MTAEQTKISLKEALKSFSEGNLTEKCIGLFNKLGYVTERTAPLYKPTFKEFRDSYIEDKPFDETKAKVDEWKYVDLLFQLSKEEVLKQMSLFDTKQVNRSAIEAYLFITIELSKDYYTRTELAAITREINRLFPMPAMILFKHCSTLTLSVINRRLHKKDEGKDVLEKVTLIKDIIIEKPHRAHIEILFDLSFDELKSKHQFTNFVDLHNAWQKTLDTKELNKRFYSELFNWYLWAISSVKFPNDIDDDKDDKVYNSESVIRLLTRLIFVWFIKEKGLIPDVLFDEKNMKRVLSDFNPASFETSKYYRAILQNLFFATLNTEMDKDVTCPDEKRRFVNPLPKYNNPDYTDQTKYRYKDYFTNPDEALKLFSTIPFLNGGLFECLDSKEDGRELRYDGFSSTESKQAFVPDKLFFAEEFILDLNAEYGTKGKKYKVEGLINILDSYKFTITENTPLEEEIALDPELLGKVFENLLASYNPETQTTARKQTGSFYTPREIVNYMVDESLIVYFKQKLNGSEEVETRLRDLFAHAENLPEFSETETDLLINAISQAKILDPACGSGAFPMGVLHRLVDLLNKLDPDNEKWNDLQIKRAIAETTEVFKSGSLNEEREIRLNEINKAFDLSMNFPDYARKLFLIENCIYGVDIQQIAIQISKLRFFISLIVDQKVNDSKPNRNILSMPNLETKFVAANTLVGLDKPKKEGDHYDMMAGEVERLEIELSSIRHKIFFTRKYSEKKALKKTEKAKREELQTALIQTGYTKNTASQMAGWNPFDPMQSAKFFDPETMFGSKAGFDVVIGNPPYVRVDDIPIEHKTIYKKYFLSCTGKYDLYYLFFEKSNQIRSANGLITFITPNKYCAATSGERLREILLDNKNSIEILSTSKLKVFDDAANYPIITLIKSVGSVGRIFVREANSIEHLQESTESSYCLTFENIKELPTSIIPINVSQQKIDIALNLLKENAHLGKYVSFSEGLRIPSKYELESKSLDSLRIVKQYQFDKWSSISDGSFISEKDFSNVISEKSDRYCKIMNKKILIAEDALEITATIDNNYHIPQGGIYFGAPYEKYLKQIYSILAVLNSKLLSKIYEILFGGMHMGGGYLRYRTNFLENLPISKNCFEIKQFSTLADYILLLKTLNRDSSFYERLIDAMVYELYLPEPIKAAGCEVLKYLKNLPELVEGENEKNLKTIEKVYKELSDPEHLVSKAIERMDAVEEIRIIEGKL